MIVLAAGRMPGCVTRTWRKAFATVLRRHRAQNGITQESLAERADIASKMVSLIERNQRNPSLNVADSIAQGLGMTLARMIPKEAEVIPEKTLTREFDLVPATGVQRVTSGL